MHRVELEPAYILHARPFRNTSLLIELFTRHHGRVSVVARSARGLKSRYRGKLQLFNYLLVSWTGRGELKNLGGVEFARAPHNLSRVNLACGFYLNELLMRLLHKEDAYAELFDRYHDSLEQFTRTETTHSVEGHLRIFEKYLLVALGYALPLLHEAQQGMPIQPEQQYAFVPHRGFILENPGQQNTLTISGASLLALHHEILDNPRVLLEIKRLLSAVLHSYLGDKPIKSRELLA